MKSAIISGIFLFCTTFSAFGKEAYVDLKDYVSRAKAVCICSVEKDNGDGTVTANVIDVPKGDLDKSIVIRGQTGHCVIDGPVSRFMRPGKKYLVFLFKNNTVGRLGGILEIGKEDTLVIQFLNGFTGASFEKKNRTQRLPLDEAVKQIKLLKKVIERAEGLKASLDSVSCVIKYHGPQDKPYYNLTLSVPSLRVLQYNPFWPVINITKNQARKIIDHLTTEGFLGSAEYYDMADPQYKGPTYPLRIQYGKGVYEGVLDWGLPMLKRLDGLRKVLNGDAAKAMDRLLARLTGHRKQWEKMGKDIEKLAGKSELVVIGKVTAIYDHTAKDGGMSYDIKIERILKGDYSEKTLHFHSGGWVGYAKYKEGEDVLLFLRYWDMEPRELLQHKPVIYLTKPAKELPPDKLQFWEVDYCLKVLTDAAEHGE